MIRLSGIVKRFGDAPALKGVELSVAEGSVTALIGPSGSGKSTLLRCVNLLEVPQQGRVQVGDEAISFDDTPRPSREAIRRLRRQSGMVFQSFQLFPHQNVVQNVAESLVTVLDWTREEAEAHSLDLLKKVGMAHKAREWPANLSGGQQQRVAIARALAASPKVLLCDEPTSALDPELAAEVVDVLRRLAAEGTTMLMATHDLRLAATIAHQVVFLEDGEIRESGSAQHIFTQPKHPRTQAFVSTLRETVLEDWSI
ncbi:ATP-binding cassette domain-containing protein [Rhodocyclus tenuis]|uniref:ATP-binding cassette domain-containing protein n=1 Tax=Rhodocyclus tenuis TaxID=1066 RepID=A0A6L5JRX9_RHOTE|nr:amino acid ABC transporter ATP-binding protein [Rhodocyclus gracilis]MQY50197.1 ATP-binding cassette domain-containing protein [Rhodocyclus gracilis]MRD71905.1 ATP-binding cassette domain-containing protein [Rhodocyclus gracilis]